MKKLLPTAMLGIAGATAVGLVALQTPVVQADEAAKREDDAVEMVLVADDDDADTNDDTHVNTNTVSKGTKNSFNSKKSRDSTNSKHSKVSRDKDRSRGDKTRDWTNDGGKKKRDWSANKTNDRSKNDTRR